MPNATKLCCELLKRWSAPDPEAPMRLIHKSRTATNVGIRINAGGDAYISIAFCPWCGTKFDVDQDHVGRKAVEVV
jgi:hypothetical protein